MLQPSFLARRARTVPQSMTCSSTVKPICFMFCARRLPAAVWMEPVTSSMITGSPLYPVLASSALAAARSNLATLDPASVESGVPHMKKEGQSSTR